MYDNQDRKIIPNDHLANERTFLAWIRTSLTFMGLGFVVVKFSLFIKQLTRATICLSFNLSLIAVG
ncbi:DUF202 domain-containing protein [Olivibacter ginsenosidimutans]